MIRQCKKHGLPEPEFISVRNLEFKTILARDVYTDTFFQKAGFNERQIRVIKLIKEKSIIALSDFQDVCKEATRKTLYRDLQGLVDKRILKAHGDRKGRKYSF
jgi:ATP-dependent DNA helicase RecG